MAYFAATNTARRIDLKLVSSSLAAKTKWRVAATISA